MKILALKRKEKTVIPGFGLTFGISLAMLSILILIPLASILVYSFRLSPSEFWQLITEKAVLSALFTSVGCSFIAAIINYFFGKRLLDGMLELPFALPTAVAGITLSKMYSDTGIVGKYFAKFGIKISYTHIGIIIALIFVGIPFVVRAVQPILEKLDNQYEEAAYRLGADRKTTFWKVIFPEIKPALLTGFGLAYSRGIGEYGSVIYISGNSLKEHTQVISYVIMQKLNYVDYPSATVIALVMLIFSFILLFLINLVQMNQFKRTNNI